MKPKLGIILICLIALWPNQLFACEPIIPLAKLFGGQDWFARSFLWLSAAVAIKCLAFVFFERRLRWWKAFIFLAIANVISSIVGVFVGIAAGNPPVLFIALPIVYALSIVPAKRLAEHVDWKILKNWNASQIAMACPVCIFATWVLFYLAAALVDTRGIALYWLLKFSYICVALFISILLTSLWEEWIVARCAAQKEQRTSFFASVVRANYVTFAIVLLVAAIEMLPKRLHSRGFLAFLIQWLN